MFAEILKFFRNNQVVIGLFLILAFLIISMLNYDWFCHFEPLTVDPFVWDYVVLQSASDSTTHRDLSEDRHYACGAIWTRTIDFVVFEDYCRMEIFNTSEWSIHQGYHKYGMTCNTMHANIYKPFLMPTGNASEIFSNELRWKALPLCSDLNRWRGDGITTLVLLNCPSWLASIFTSLELIAELISLCLILHFLCSKCLWFREESGLTLSMIEIPSVRVQHSSDNSRVRPSYEYQSILDNEVP